MNIPTIAGEKASITKLWMWKSFVKNIDSVSFGIKWMVTKHYSVITSLQLVTSNDVSEPKWVLQRPILF